MLYDLIKLIKNNEDYQKNVFMFNKESKEYVKLNQLMEYLQFIILEKEEKTVNTLPNTLLNQKPWITKPMMIGASIFGIPAAFYSGPIAIVGGLLFGASLVKTGEKLKEYFKPRGFVSQPKDSTKLQ